MKTPLFDNKIKVFLLIVITFCLINISALIYFFVINNIMSNKCLAYTPKKRLQHFANINSQWGKDYEDTKLGFMLEIPQKAVIENYLFEQHNKLVTFKDDDLFLEVRLGKGKIDKIYYFLDSPVTTSTIIDGHEARVFKSETGYCDGPSCSQPFVTYITENNNKLYEITFSGDTEISETERKVLASFKFTD